MYVTIMKLPKIAYEYEEVELNFNGLDRFEILENRRKIRFTEVEDILSTLRQGGHFNTPIAVHRVKRGGKFVDRILDGNHRFEAVRMYLNYNKDVSFSVPLMVYKNLSSDEENSLIDLLNHIINYSVDDVLNQYAKTLPIFNELLARQFPIHTYKSKTSGSVPLGLVVKILHSTFNTKNLVFSPRTPSKRDIVVTARGYGEEHAKLLIEFFNVFTEAMGGFRDNKFLRHVFCAPAFNIWHINRSTYDSDDLVKRMAGCLNDTEVLQRIHEHSESAVELMRERILFVMDRHSRKKMLRGVAKAPHEMLVGTVHDVKK